MKFTNLLMLLATISTTFTRCDSSFKKKEKYLNTRIPMLKKNLTKSEYHAFIESMDFDKKGNLNCMDLDLLKKGTADKHDSISHRINANIMGSYSTLTTADPRGSETNPAPKLATYTTIDNKNIDIEQFTKANTIYLIISVNSGPSLKFLKYADRIASDPVNADFQFVALFANPDITLQNYKKGDSYKEKGFLDEHWLCFSNEQNIISEIKQMYKAKRNDIKIGDVFPEIFYYKNGEFTSTNGKNIYQLQELLNDLKKTLDTNAPKPNFG